MADVTREPRAYELMAVFVPELSDEELVEQIERVTGYITDQQGVITEVLRESPWGRRRLAYTIRFNSVDYRDGIYVVYHFDNVPSGVFDIERELKLDVRVMRYLLVHDDPLAGEKDSGQNAEGEGSDAETDGESSAEAPVAVTEVADASEDEADAAVVEEAPVEVAAVAPVEEAPAEIAAVEEVPVEAVTEVVEATPAAVEPEVEVVVPAEDALTSEEETKED